MADAQSNYYNAQAASLAAQVANQAAQLAFQRERFERLELPQFQEMTALEKEKLAFAKATEVWNEAFKEASLTGTYQGKPTAEWLLSSAQLTGQLQGSQTLAAQQQSFQQQLGLAGLLGNYQGLPTLEQQQWQAGATGYVSTPSVLSADEMAEMQRLSEAVSGRLVNGTPQNPGDTERLAALRSRMAGTSGAIQTPTLAREQAIAGLTGMYGGAPTEAASEFSRQLALERAKLDQAQAQFEQTFGLSEGELTGRYNGQNTLGRDTMENQQANQLLGLAASLRGPRNAFQFAKVLGGTPGGLQDVLGSMAGRYNLPAYQGGTAAPEAVNLQNFVGDVGAAAAGQPGGYNPTPGGTWAQPAPSYSVNPPGAQAPSNSWNYQPTGDGSQQIYPPGIAAPVQAAQVSSPTPLSAGQLSQLGAQAMAAQPYALPTSLPAPSTWNADSFNNLGGYRQDLMLGAYEAKGWDPDAALAQFKAALPDSGGPTSGAIKVAGL